MSSATTPVVNVQNVSKTYRDGWFGGRRVQALRGASFQVLPGEIFGLIGPNGAGKTTLIKVLLGIVRRWEGQATLLGHPAGHRAGRARVGYLPEGHRIPRHLTGNTALEYYGSLSRLPLTTIRERRGPLLKRLGLTKAADRSVKGYSKGMLQRLGLAQALLHDPDLLFLDEPTDGVDPRGRAEIRDFLVELTQSGKTIFINSHQLQELELVCSRVAMLDKGEIRFLGTLDEATSDRDEVLLTVAGGAAQLPTLLPANTQLQALATSDQFRFQLAIEQQSDLDQLIDRLRGAGISIVSINRERRSLEQAFLDLVPGTSD
ncbi:MAG: ABC transporter ATP-binding protein [Planctomycetaceae bacterium]